MLTFLDIPISNFSSPHHPPIHFLLSFYHLPRPHSSQAIRPTLLIGNRNYISTMAVAQRVVSWNNITFPPQADKLQRPSQKQASQVAVATPITPQNVMASVQTTVETVVGTFASSRFVSPPKLS